MSIFADRIARCPACDHEESRSVAQSVNGGRSPALREDILAGRFHVFRCGACGAESRVDVPFLYVDFDRKEWICVMPAAAEPGWTAHEPAVLASFSRALGAEAPPVAQALAEGFRVRLVFGLAALREKLLAFDAALDDALLEALKLDLMWGRLESGFCPSARPRLHAAGPGALHFYVADALRGEGLLDVEVARAAYARMAERADDYRAILDPLREGVYVDLGRMFWPEAPAQAAA